jgi:hypothetical protein
VIKLKRELTPDLVNLKVNFILDFIDYWEKVRSIIWRGDNKKVSWKIWDSLTKSMFASLTEPFYSKWKHLGILSWVDGYVQTFSSIYLNLKGAGILIPRQLLLYESYKPNHNFIQTLRESPTPDDFVRVLYALVEDLNIRLKKSDYKVIQKLANPRFSKSLDRFPKIKELAYTTRQAIKTVASSMNYLVTHHILTIQYLVDLGRIGYQTKLFIYYQDDSEDIQNIQRYFSLRFPLTSDNLMVAVVQYPYRDTGALRKIENKLNPVQRIILAKKCKGWNMQGLTTNPEDRWQLRPPILEGGVNWDKQLVLNSPTIELNLDPLFDPYPLALIEARLLGIVHSLSTMEEDPLTKQLNISRSHLRKIWKKLLRGKIIFRFPIFSNLGLGSWIYFLVRDISADNLEKLVQHLRFFPYIDLYYDFSNGTLIGEVLISPLWTHLFLSRLTALPKVFPSCTYQYYIGPEAYCPWGFDILNTYDWGNVPRKKRDQNEFQ